MRGAIEVGLWGWALLTAIQLPGAVFDAVLRRNTGTLVQPILLLIGLGLVLRGLLGSPWPRRRRAAGAVAVAVGLTVVLAQVEVLKLDDKVAQVPDLGILVPAPGRRYTDCRGQPPRCHEHVTNQLGFRGILGRRPTPESPLLAFVGDSYVFGSGVGDDDTVPAAVARALSDLQPPVAVVNAGIAGLNGGSFPAIIRYVRARLQPDLVVVLLKDDDLDATDVLTRWDHFGRSLPFRMLYVSNLETVYETTRQLGRRWFGQEDRQTLVGRNLDAIAAAARGAKLLIIADLDDDVRPAFSAWLAAHPDVAHVASWEDPGYWQAERIPSDGHWTEAGCAQIASVVAPALRAQLAGAR